MSGDINFSGPKQGSDDSGTAALFVSLYVVVLAFFILLTSNASFDTKKSRNVMDSVNKAFAKDITIQTNFEDPSVGAEITSARFFQEVQDTVASIIPLYEVDIVTDDRVMRLTMPATALFNSEDASLRPDRIVFYDRLAAVLTQWKPNSTIHLEFLQGVNKPKRNSPDAASVIEVKRGGNFARFLENKGVPPDSLSIGLDPTNQGKITFEFTVVEMHGTVNRSHTIAPAATPAAPQQSKPEGGKP